MNAGGAAPQGAITMLFSSIAFVIFLAVVVLIYPRLRHAWQNLFLLAASYFFYGYWDWRFAFLLLTSTAVDFCVARRMGRASLPSSRKALLVVSISVNLGILCFFKYFNFFVGSMAAVLEGFGFEAHLPILRVVLPVGISFYTFQTMSYVIDVYRGKVQPALRFTDYALYLAFFPQLLAGPISRASHLLPQVTAPRSLTRDSVTSGLGLMLIGYFRKVAIADTLAPIVARAFSDPSSQSSGELLGGLYAFAIQIYGDFAGYSDIARGTARLLGFNILENFQAPYLSRSVTEFWRRWHISLSTWLRDYLYISMGGSRGGRGQTIRNTIITMFLGGLWHGAAWVFAFWGILHGLFLVMHRLLLRGRKPESDWPSAWPQRAIGAAKVVFTFHLVALAWVPFRAPNLSAACAFLRGILRCDHLAAISPTVLTAGALILALDAAQCWHRSHTWITDAGTPRLLRYAAAQILIVSVVVAAVAHANTVTPFIYFQF